MRTLSLPFASLFALSLAACGGDAELLGGAGAQSLEAGAGGSDESRDDGNDEAAPSLDGAAEGEGEREGPPGGGGGGWDRDDCKIEDGDLGRTDVTLRVGGSTVRVASWQGKADSPGEYVGFTLAVTGAEPRFLVKAGGERHEGSGTSWSHPNGDAGPSVPGISHIDFCGNCEEGQPCGPSAGEGEGEGEGEGDGNDLCYHPESGQFVPCTDSDGDGLSDEDEGLIGTNPLDPDSDDDGLSDGDEVEGGTDPLDRDTDGGGVNDGDEVDAGTDPLDPSDDSAPTCGLYDPESGTCLD